MKHPTGDEIARVVAGRSSDTEAESVLSHIESCPDCESVMDDLENAPTEIIDRIRQPLSRDPYAQEQDCRQFLSLAETIADEKSGESSAEPRLDAADPADAPEVNIYDNIYATAPSTQSADENPVPTQIGRYQVQSQLGRGGFGVVLLAMDQELNRQIAIKLPLYGRFKSEDEIQRFVREARTAANLKHPHIVTVYDVGRLDDGTPFVVMEYVEGSTLKDVLESERLTYERIAELMIPIAEAVGVAHQQGFVHRDLKPENILIDMDGKPYVADFGLAVHESDQRFRAGEFSGTPCYMSPEQIRGEVHRLDGRADIWALGTVLYEMLTGRRAFAGTNPRQVADEILHRLPKPPRQIDGKIPDELQRICLRCCEKEISDRYSAAADIVQDLHSFLDADQETAPSASPPPNDNRGIAERFGVLFATVAAAAVIVAAVWYAASGPREKQAETVAGMSPSDESRQSKAMLDAMQDTIDVLVWAPDDRRRQGIRLQDQGALPLRTNDLIRVQAELAKPSYVYIVWIDSAGVTFPVYPWKPGDWSDRPKQETPVRHVSLPDEGDEGWPMDGVAGMETLLLLVRDAPLPASIDLEQLLAGLPKQLSQHPGSLVWFVNGEVMMGRKDRAPRFFEVQRIDDHVLRTQRQIHESLGPHFDSIRAVSFANGGD